MKLPDTILFLMNTSHPLSLCAALATLCTLFVFPLTSCTSLPSGGTGTGIDPDAKAVLQKASETLAAADAFSFRVQRDVPAVIAVKAGMRENADIRVSAKRPDQVMAVDSSGGVERRFYYDGKQITRYGGPGNHYAVADAPATTDEMIPFLNEKWGVHPPLAGLLLSNPLEFDVEKAQEGTLVGEETIDGELCNHLNFIADGVVWDLWISAGDHLPRRFDVTITELDGLPRGSTTISEWNLAPSFPSDYFRAIIPAGFTQRKMEELH